MVVFLDLFYSQYLEMEFLFMVDFSGMIILK